MQSWGICTFCKSYESSRVISAATATNVTLRAIECQWLLWLLTDAEGTHVTVDVGDCVNICNRWVSGFAGMQV